MNNALVQKAIYDTYCPRLDNGVPDPAVIYVGRLTDGLSQFLPEVFQQVFRTTEPSKYRGMLKRMLSDIDPRPRIGDIDRPAGLMAAQNLSISVTRPGKFENLRLTRNIIDNEPGEMLNSPQLFIDPETNQPSLMEYMTRTAAKKAGWSGEGDKPMKSWTPRIREDKRYGLHYLQRDDSFHIIYDTRRRQHVDVIYRLRPQNEGSSLVGAVRGEEVKVW